MGVITEIERQKYFAYLDGVADGLNESRNDVNSVLDKIRTEIEELADADGYGDYQLGFSFGLMMAMEIIDKYKGSEVEE